MGRNPNTNTTAAAAAREDPSAAAAAATAGHGGGGGIFPIPSSASSRTSSFPTDELVLEDDYNQGSEADLPDLPGLPKELAETISSPRRKIGGTPNTTERSGTQRTELVEPRVVEDDNDGRGRRTTRTSSSTSTRTNKMYQQPNPFASDPNHQQHHQQQPMMQQQQQGQHPLSGVGNDLQFQTTVDPINHANQNHVQMDPFRAQTNIHTHASEAAKQQRIAEAHITQAEQMFPSGPMQPQPGAAGSGVGGVDPNNGNNTNMMAYLKNSTAGKILQDSSHPGVCIFHVLFKLLALVVYILGGFLAGSSNFVTITVICIILLALDFWVVKNITGRLLVGLRWWNMVNDDGTNRWIFESSERKYDNAVDNAIFWTVTYGTPLIWSFLLFIAILKLEVGWLLVVVVALVLSSSNVYGYWKCSSEQKQKFKMYMEHGTAMAAGAALRNMGTIASMASAAGGMGGAQQQQQHQRPMNTFV